MSSVDTILQRADMEMTRTPQALCDWVDSKASELSKTDEGKHYARSGALLPKKLWEEVRPLGLFALRRYGPRSDVKCTPNLTNNNYDGRIEFDDTSNPTIYVEVTYAKDGYDERWRLEVLGEKGSVNALGRISTSGTKASGRRSIEVQDEAVDHEETRCKSLKILRERITGKTSKTYGPDYVLIIVVDDYLPFRTEDDRAILMERAKSFVESAELNFGAVYLLGSSGNYLSSVYGEI